MSNILSNSDEIIIWSIDDDIEGRVSNLCINFERSGRRMSSKLDTWAVFWKQTDHLHFNRTNPIYHFDLHNTQLPLITFFESNYDYYTLIDYNLWYNFYGQ